MWNGGPIQQRMQKPAIPLNYHYVCKMYVQGKFSRGDIGGEASLCRVVVRPESKCAQGATAAVACRHHAARARFRGKSPRAAEPATAVVAASSGARAAVYMLPPSVNGDVVVARRAIRSGTRKVAVPAMPRVEKVMRARNTQ